MQTGKLLHLSVPFISRRKKKKKNSAGQSEYRITLRTVQILQLCLCTAKCGCKKKNCSHLFLVLTRDGEDDSVQQGLLIYSCQLSYKWPGIRQEVKLPFLFPFLFYQMLAGLVCVNVLQHHQGALLRKQHLKHVESLHDRNHTLALLRSEDLGWNITHIPTLPPSDGRWTSHHKSRASRRPIDVLPKWPTPCLSSWSRWLYPTCQFRQIHTTRPGKTRQNLSRKLQSKEIICWVSRLTWSVFGLLTGYYAQKNLLE